MKKVIFPFILIIDFLVAQAQKENNEWIFASDGIMQNFLNFNSGFPDTSTVLGTANFFLTVASICDTNGQLLFYTNGNVLYNRNNDTLLNGFGINPGTLTNIYFPDGMGIEQGAFIIPYPGHTGQYLAFYVSGELCQVGTQTVMQPIFLPFSVIDMSLDGGLGGIIPGKKDIHAYDDTLIYGRITGVKHANGRDWWIVAHQSATDIYDILLVTPDTLIMHQQQIGRPDVFEQFAMQAVFSPQGDKYVIGLTEFLNDTFPNVVDLFDFDRCTGMFSNEQHVTVPSRTLISFGCSFSPNGRWLFVNTAKNIWQYDTWSNDIDTTRIKVATWDTAANPYYKFLFEQLAPDGKIYISNYVSENFLHVIDQPDIQGVGCNVIQGGLQLPVVNSYVMPNTTIYALGPVTGSVCDSLTGIKENDISDLKFQIYPNPVLQNGIITFNYVLPQNKEGKIEIFDITGKKVYAARLSQWSTIHRVKAIFGSGVYAAKITSEKNRTYLKFVVMQ